MLYNKNIVQDILSSHFWNEIELYVGNCIINLDSDDLENISDNQIDYALLESIVAMEVYDYNVQNEDLDDELDNVSGTLEVTAEIEGYVHWDGEDIVAGYEEINMGLSFDFSVNKGKYMDLELEYL